MKAYNAITGSEALEIVLTRLRRALENTGEFTSNVTFPCWKLEVSCSFEVFPRELPEIKAEIKVQEKQSGFQSRKEPKKHEVKDELGWVGAEPKHVEGEHDLVFGPGLEPDDVRKEHDLPLPDEAPRGGV